MALDLDVWAQLNLVGNIGWSDYLTMTPEEANACLKALNDAIKRGNKQRESEAAFDNYVRQVQGGLNK